MNIANELANYLADNGFGTLGTDIFVDQIPDNQNGIYTMNGSGELNNYVPISNTLVDIYIKNTSASSAVSIASQIRNFIHRMHTTETDNAFIYSILVIGDIEAVERDQEYAKIYKLSVQLINRDTSLIS